jgi:hypothetical protein
LGRIEVWEGGSEAARAGDDARDAESDVLGALIADDLEGSAGRNGAFERRRAIGVEQRPGEGGEEAAHGGPEADAGDVHVHPLAVSSGGGLA